MSYCRCNRNDLLFLEVFRTRRLQGFRREFLFLKISGIYLLTLLLFLYLVKSVCKSKIQTYQRGCSGSILRLKHVLILRYFSLLYRSSHIYCYDMSQLFNLNMNYYFYSKKQSYFPQRIKLLQYHIVGIYK